MSETRKVSFYRHNKKSVSINTPVIMGILNVTPDSFSDGGRHLSVTAALEQAGKMLTEGAHIIDIGGESSRPGAEPVSESEEIDRVIPVIKALRKKTDCLISIDTYKAGTAKAALDAGADFVNDISALRFDSEMGETVAESGCSLVMMHMKGTPRDMQRDPVYEEVNSEIMAFFDKQLAFAELCGIKPERIILDPGLGFGKRLVDNLDILSHISVYERFKLPLLIGSSRKSFINMLTDSNRPSSDRLGGSIASAVWAWDVGAHIFRVHDVADTIEAIAVYQAIRGNA